MHVDLKTQAIWVWVPGAIVGVLLNLQVRHLGTHWQDMSSGMPNYTPRLLIIIHIVNNEPAIPEISQQRLFKPFLTTKLVGQGTGLGLSISYDIVTNKHGGQLYCQSSLETGTEFTIEIPKRQAVYNVM
ncbi:MAG: hypothetical protein DCF22_08640 [Leptolyngbya sp.]|nr:MAG: hypothetical protein DCF22_08640 [Leptolyngbya sp.]